MATYTELVDKIISWSNRDVSVFGTDAMGNGPGYTQIRDFINYAADNAYRKLRVVPLEATRTFTVREDQEGETSLNIPVDAIEFIQLSRVGEDGEHYPYSSKLDIISFREVVERLDGYVTRNPRSGNQREDPSLRFWTRHQGEIVVNPPFIEGDKFELYYYRRLPAADARFAFIESQYTTAFVDDEISNTRLDELKLKEPELDFRANGTEGYYDVLNIANDLTELDDWDMNVMYPDESIVRYNGYRYISIREIPALAGDPGNPTPDTENSMDWVLDSTGRKFSNEANLVPRLTQNWLRDDNEKVLLFGALAEAFDFLEEPEQSQKYMAKFMKEIEDLNMEDTKRIPSGGTIYINYGSNLL